MFSKKGKASKQPPSKQPKKETKTKTKKNAAAKTVQEESSSEENDATEAINYIWTGVMSLSYGGDRQFHSREAYIDPKHCSSNIKGAVGRPAAQWEFIFSPSQFDDNIDITQFQKCILSMEEMQELGIKASVIRQDVIELALKMEGEERKEGEDPGKRE